MQRIVKQITNAVPRHPQRISAAIRERIEHMNALLAHTYSLPKLMALLDELDEALLLEQLVASAKERNIFVPSVPSPDQVVPTSGGNPTPLYFSDFSAWPEAEALDPGEKAEIMGYDDARIESNFGHMFKALASGTPPHGGIAWGLDRLLMILLNEPNIREVMAFPKTGEGRDLLMQAPSPASAKALRELKIEIKK